jgi:hypothetical protein
MRSPATEIPGHAAKGTLTPRHRSRNRPDVAVKGNDHEWLVALVVYVLPCSCSNRGGRRRVAMLVCTDGAYRRRLVCVGGLCGVRFQSVALGGDGIGEVLAPATWSVESRTPLPLSSPCAWVRSRWSGSVGPGSVTVSLLAGQ